RNTLPTLCMLRILSSTTTIGIFSDRRKSFTDFRPSLSMPNLRIDKGNSPLIHLYPAFPILFDRSRTIFYIDLKYIAHEKTLPTITEPCRFPVAVRRPAGPERGDRYGYHPKDPPGRIARFTRYGHSLSPYRRER